MYKNVDYERMVLINSSEYSELVTCKERLSEVAGEETMIESHEGSPPPLSPQEPKYISTPLSVMPETYPIARGAEEVVAMKGKRQRKLTTPGREPRVTRAMARAVQHEKSVRFVEPEPPPTQKFVGVARLEWLRKRKPNMDNRKKMLEVMVKMRNTYKKLFKMFAIEKRLMEKRRARQAKRMSEELVSMIASMNIVEEDLNESRNVDELIERDTERKADLIDRVILPPMSHEMNGEELVQLANELSEMTPAELAITAVQMGEQMQKEISSVHPDVIYVPEFVGETPHVDLDGSLDWDGIQLDPSQFHTFLLSFGMTPQQKYTEAATQTPKQFTRLKTPTFEDLMNETIETLVPGVRQIQRTPPLRKFPSQEIIEISPKVPMTSPPIPKPRKMVSGKTLPPHTPQPSVLHEEHISPIILSHTSPATPQRFTQERSRDIRHRMEALQRELIVRGLLRDENQLVVGGGRQLLAIPHIDKLLKTAVSDTHRTATSKPPPVGYDELVTLMSDPAYFDLMAFTGDTMRKVVRKIYKDQRTKLPYKMPRKTWVKQRKPPKNQ